MSRPSHTADQQTAQIMMVYRAADLVVSDGANLGDPLGTASDMVAGDLYSLDKMAKPLRLRAAPVDGGRHFSVAHGSATGRIGAPLHLDCHVTLMALDGMLIEALVLVELDRKDGLIAEIYLLPMSRIVPRTEYALVALDRHGAREALARMGCVSFATGTRIATATGALRAVEDLRPGDRILTRDNGVQRLRWVGRQTLRATGAFAPVVIEPGALKNDGPLLLSPNTRLFVYQREDVLGIGQPEVAIRAEMLVDGEDIRRAEGGFVEYRQLLFDNHEFVFAEGIAAESLTLDMHAAEDLPEGLTNIAPAGQKDSAPAPFDLTEAAIDRSIPVDILRRAAVN